MNTITRKIKKYFLDKKLSLFFLPRTQKIVERELRVVDLHECCNAIECDDDFNDRLEQQFETYHIPNMYRPHIKKIIQNEFTCNGLDCCGTIIVP